MVATTTGRHTMGIPTVHWGLLTTGGALSPLALKHKYASGVYTLLRALLKLYLIYTGEGPLGRYAAL